MRFFFLLVSCFFLFFGSIPLTAHSQQYNFRSFSIEDGLPRSGVYSILEDHEGFLWIATEGGGVSVFDGDKFTTYTRADGLAAEVVRVVFEDKQGRMWFGTQNGGVSSFSDGKFFTYGEASGLTTVNVRAITEDLEGNLWFGTLGGGVFKLPKDKIGKQGKVLEHFDTEHGLVHNKVRAALLDASGRLWFGTDGGLSSFENGTFVNYTDQNGLPHKKILTLFESTGQKLWIGTQEGAACLYEGKFDVYTTIDNLIHDRVRAISEDNEGNIWFGTRAGACKFDGKNFQYFTEREGLSNNRIRCITKDSQGNLWFGTYFGGINRFSGQAFVHFRVEDGLLDNQVITVYQDTGSDILLGTNEGVNLLRFNSQDIQYVEQISVIPEFQSFETYALKRDVRNWLWAGTNVGLGVVTPEEGLRIGESNDLPEEAVHSLLFLSDSVLLAGTEYGLFKVTITNSDTTPFIYEQFGPEEGLNGSWVGSMCRGADGSIWVGCRDGGVSLFRDDRFLPTEFPEAMNKISTILIGPDKNLWVATAGQGIFRFPDKSPVAPIEYTHFTMEDKLTTNHTVLVVFDSDDQLWVGSEIGLDRVLLDANGQIESVENYSKEEGFTGIESHENAVCVDNYGRIWFGTIKGATYFNQDHYISNRTPPYIHFTKVRLAFKDIDWSQSEYAKEGVNGRFSIPNSLVLPYNMNHLNFDFTAISLRAPAKVRYTWKLEGLDEQWSPVQSNLEVSYSNLPPGDYTFLVKAGNEDGYWTKDPAQFKFTILPPFWRTWWFYIAVVVIGITSFFVFVRIRERRLLRERRILQKKVDERTKEVVMQKEQITEEKKKSDRLLLNILPYETAEELKSTGKSRVRHHDEVSVLFTDFVGFTKITEKLSHQELINELDVHFRQFDEIVDRYGVEKIKTIGDAYMCAGGVPVATPMTPVRAVLTGLEMQKLMMQINQEKKDHHELEWRLRIGIDTGPVITGVVGKNKFAYDIWGDTVNTASRMESSGEPGRVNISGSTYQAVKEFFDCQHRGKIEAKNKGEIDMYFVDGLKAEYAANDPLTPNKKLLDLLKKRQQTSPAVS